MEDRKVDVLEVQCNFNVMEVECQHLREQKTSTKNQVQLNL
jgi:hypothetical protein